MLNVLPLFVAQQGLGHDRLVPLMLTLSIDAAEAARRFVFCSQWDALCFQKFRKQPSSL